MISATVRFCTASAIVCGLAGCGESKAGARDNTPGSTGGAANAGGTRNNTGGSAQASAGSSQTGGSANPGGGNNPGGGTGGSGSGGGSGPVIGPTPTEACAGLALEQDVLAAGRQTDRFSWNDAACRPRTAAMARVGGGYVRQFSYEVNGAPRLASATDANGHPGWGFGVNHIGTGAWVQHGDPGTFKPVFVGAHHALYEYAYNVADSPSPLPVTFHWLFATGRDNPLLAINYDLNQSPKGLNADTRTPYGDIMWDGDDQVGQTVVSGVGWGDRYKFVTTQAPLTMDSAWDYSQPNLVPYVLEWTDASDAEMGAVQTQTYLQKDAGGYWLYGNWGKTSANQIKSPGQIGNMPVTWNWTYQLNQYELCIEQAACLNNTTASHRLSWGSNYGALGGITDMAQVAHETYAAYGDDKQLSGWPYQSYSVFMVLGKHSAAPVFSQAREIEIVQKTTLTASVGSVTTMVPGGVGRTDLVAANPPGYDHRYSTWSVQAAGNKAAFTVAVAEGALLNPVLVVSGFTGAAVPSVKVDGVAGTPDVTFLASLVAERQELWITFRPGWQGTHEIAIE